MAALQVIDLGEVSAARLHAGYVALAESLIGDQLMLLLARPQAHYSIGASQYSAAELDLQRCQAAGVPVIQRPIGGGTVWVDDQQLCFFILSSGQFRASNPTGIFDRGLSIATQALRHLGVDAQRVGQQDLWLQGAKCLGSGAATLGATQVFASSLLRHFPVLRFVVGLRLPSDTFRERLAHLLDQQIVDMERVLSEPCSWETLASVLIQATADHYAVRVQHRGLSAEEEIAVQAAMQDWEWQLEEEGVRLVPEGIKIQHGLYAAERHGIGVLLRDGIVDQVWSSDTSTEQEFQACVGERPEGSFLSNLRSRSQIPEAWDTLSSLTKPLLQLT